MAFDKFQSALILLYIRETTILLDLCFLDAKNKIRNKCSFKSQTIFFPHMSHGALCYTKMFKLFIIHSGKLFFLLVHNHFSFGSVNTCSMRCVKQSVGPFCEGHTSHCLHRVALSPNIVSESKFIYICVCVCFFLLNKLKILCLHILTISVHTHGYPSLY